uniref:Uncharacterized protein n=1 Tax=Anguilla anguilla TaxID=7936 RepID=A0A0E9PGS4_ANGAN
MAKEESLVSHWAGCHRNPQPAQHTPLLSFRTVLPNRDNSSGENRERLTAHTEAQTCLSVLLHLYGPE